MSENQPENVDLWEDTENSEDSNLTSEEAREAVVYASDWTVETILSQLRSGRISINPSFQRREAWTEKRQCKYIESLFLGIPIPQIVLAENSNKKGQFIVLDGKQRLISLMKFGGIGIYKNKDLVLKGLDVLKELNGQTFNNIRNDLTLDEMVSSFENSTVRSVVLRNWKSDKLLHEVFLRLNTGSVQLSPQELRLAMHPGEFSQFLMVYTENSEGIKFLLNIQDADYRMRDIELLLRYIAFSIHWNSYNGDLKGFLDSVTAELNSEWSSRKDEVEEICRQFEGKISAYRDVFEGDIGRKYLSDLQRYETRFNRAALDAQLHGAESADDIRNKSREAIQEAWKGVCSNDKEFLRSIEGTTKRIDSVRYRVNTWKEILGEID